MFNLKNTLLFVASLIVVIMVSMSMANAEEQTTVTPKEFVTNVAAVPGKVSNHIKNEWEDIKEYQKKSWSEMKQKWPFSMIKGSNAS
tara:strand:+ start:687 stop:947 length:261 start_codon:yes stop_codon:yes gene_type:complete